MHCFHQCHRFVATRNDHGISALHHGERKVIGERGSNITLWCAGERRAGNLSKRLALREEFTNHRGKLLRINVPHRQNAHGDRAGHRDVIKHGNQFACRFYIFLGAGHHDRIGLLVSHQFERLGEVQHQVRGQHAAATNTQTPHLLL